MRAAYDIMMRTRNDCSFDCCGRYASVQRTG